MRMRMRRRERRGRRRSRRRWRKIILSIIERSKSRGADIIPNIFSLLHPLVQSRP